MAKRSDPLGQFSKPYIIPAPVGGWNARDPFPALPPQDAIILENFIPGMGGVSMRPGYTVFATGIGGSVNSLLEYNGPVVMKCFAASGANIYDVTAGGAVGAPVVTGLSGDQWQSRMYTTPAPANYLVICNGVDPVQEFDGTTWTVPTITGVTSANLSNVGVIANRLWFIEKNTLRLWYLGIGSISGSATLFDVGDQAFLGGSLVAMTTWSQDGGAGPNDYAVFFTTAGQVIIYQGTDPSSVNTWSLVGRFRIPEPVGMRCVLKSGADVAVITTLGVVALSAILPISISGQGKAAVTDKIKGAFQTAYAVGGSIFGWDIVEYPRGALVIVNVPQPGGMNTYQQYVMNTVTGMWCNFTNLNAICWNLFDQNMHFGDANGNVNLFDFGQTDNDTPISGVCLPAFNDFGQPGNKRFLMARPLYTGAIGSDPPLELRVDYDVLFPTQSQTSIPSGGSPWGSPWGSSWGPSIGAISDWQSVAGFGRVGSVILSISSNVGWTINHIDILAETGGLF